MPFVNRAQARACWAAAGRAEAAGKKPSWDCHKWAAESPAWADLPEGKVRSRSKSPKRRKTKTAKRKSVSKSKGAKVHVGPRGGKYIMRGGRRVYIK